MSVSFEIKSAQLPLVALLLKTGNLPAVMGDLVHQFGPDSESPDFFDQDPLVIDFSQLDSDVPISELSDLSALLIATRSCRLVPVAVRGCQGDWLQAAKDAGLVEAPVEVTRVRPEAVHTMETVEIVKEVARGPATMVVDKPCGRAKIYARGLIWSCLPW